jgi:GNAT superfamily N-acetyltransferase
MTKHIRLAAVSDARALATIHVEGWQAAYQHIVPPELFASRSVDARERDFVELLSHPGDDDRVWVCESPRDVVGFAYTRSGKDVDIAQPGELKLFYVSPALRGSGIGLALFEHAMADLQGRSLSPYLYTFRDNAAARQWYEKRGWRADGAAAPWSDKGDYPELIEVRYRPAPV